jgi:hypothetical protein
MRRHILGLGDLPDDDRLDLDKLNGLSLDDDRLDLAISTTGGLGLGDSGMDLDKLNDGGLGLNKDGEVATTSSQTE